MKVFTVGLDEKPANKDEKDSTKPEPLPDGPPVQPPPPMITIEKKSRGYKSYLMCMLTVFFILLFAVILSELAYNRARDESYLRLRWAELKHRMAMSMGWGCDGCMNNNNNNMMFTTDQQQQPIVPSTLYRPDRIEALPLSETTTESTPTTPATTTESTKSSSIETANPTDTTTEESPKAFGDPRLEFLRQILTKIREEAEKAGIDGTMQVSLIRVDPSDMNQDSSSSLENFGDFQPPMGLSAPFPMSPLRRILLGPWQSDEYSNDIDDSRQLPDFMATRRVDFMGPPMVMPAMNTAPGASSMMGPSAPFSAPVLPQIFIMNRMMQSAPQSPMMPPPSLQGSMMGMPQPQVQPQPQMPLIDRPWFGAIPGINNDQWLNDQNTWQASLERNNEWNVQRTGLMDNLDQRMSQAVPQFIQDQSPWWSSEENQWNGNDLGQQSGQPQWPDMLFKPMDLTVMQPQPALQPLFQPILPGQQQQQQQQPQPQPMLQQQQQPLFFFPQQPFGNMNNPPFNGPPQFPAPEASNAQQSSAQQQQQQQLPQQQEQPQSIPVPAPSQQAQLPQFPILPQIMPVGQVQPDVAPPVVETPQQTPVVAVPTSDSWPRPEQSVQEPSNDGMKSDQPMQFIPQFLQVDEPRHVDQEAMLE